MDWGDQIFTAQGIEGYLAAGPREKNEEEAGGQGE